MQHDLIGAIYDAPMAVQPWVGLTRQLRHTLGATAAMLKFSKAHARDGLNRFVFDAAWDPRESWQC